MFVDQKKTKIIHNKCNQRLHVFKIDIGLNLLAISHKAE